MGFLNRRIKMETHVIYFKVASLACTQIQPRVFVIVSKSKDIQPRLLNSDFSEITINKVMREMQRKRKGRKRKINRR
jgi:hypothetical protein